MAHVLGTRQFLLLLTWTIVFLQIHQVKTEVRIPCGYVKDWFPSGVKPQSSKPPYVLDVIRPDGRSVRDAMVAYRNESHYGPGQQTYTITLNGTGSGNATENFTGFMIYVYNEFEDEDSGHFVKPLPAGVSMKECHFNMTSQLVEWVENSTSNNQWTSLQIKWMSPKKDPSGKITIRASVVKDQGVYWEGIALTLNHMCPTPGCYIPDGCPHGLARNKFGCITCECAGAASITAGFTSLLTIVFTLISNLM
ncbi:hypothetical protein ACROYT_G017917 [Oculina patagonica]